MPKNLGYVTDQDFPNSVKGWGGEGGPPLVEGEWEILLGVKTSFCKYWTSIKIKISETCVYKEYEVKIKMVQYLIGAMVKMKMKFLLVYYMKIFT